jgi:Tol biopolymer transport system component
MKSERWHEAERLHHSALERKPEERAAFLAEACAGDEALRREVESLFRSGEPQGNIINAAFNMTAQLQAGQGQTMVGRQLGPYQLLSLLGAGGMGEVYRAKDSRLDREVAIKVLPSHLPQDAIALERFKREAKAVAALSHPNILSIHDFGEEQGRCFAVMELLEGETLRSHLARATFPWREASEIGAAIAEGLSAAHTKGITHRDLKPENIFLTTDGQVKILDFGIARVRPVLPTEAVGSASTIANTTEPGMLMGTVGYMSPEQVRCESAEAPSDIFSLGCVLYEMLTGQRAFARKTPVETMVAVLRDDPPTLAESGIEVPLQLEQVIRRCLKRQPEARFQSAHDLAGELRAVAGESATATAWLARSMAGIRPALWAGTVLLLALIAALWWQPWRKTTSGLVSGGLAMTQLTYEGKARDAAISPDGKSFAYVLIEPGQQSLWIKQIATGSSLQLVPPADVRYLAPTFSNDGNLIYFGRRERNDPSRALYRIPLLGGAPEKLAVGVNSPITFSPDGRQLAFIREGADGESRLMVATSDCASERALATHKLPESFSIEGVAWSPDGETIVCAARSFTRGKAGFHLVEIRVRDGTERPLTEHRWTSVRRFAWLPHGRGLIIVATDHPSPLSHQICYVSYPDGKERSITHDLNDYRSMSVGPDGETFLTVQVHQIANIWVTPTNNTSLAKQISFGVGAYDGSNGVSWTPDGQIVYASNVSGTRKIWMMGANGENPRQMSHGPGEDLHPSVSLDGQHMVYDSDRAGTRNIWRMDVDQGTLRRITYGDREEDPRISPDGRWIVYTSIQSGNVALWKIPIDGGEPAQITRQHSEFAVISPDGRHIASYLQNEQTRSLIKVALFRFDGGNPLKIFDIETSAERLVRWSLEGNALTYVSTRNGVSTLLSQPISGGPPQVVADFKRDRIFSFEWSPDGKQLAVSRGIIQYDVVQISKFQ